MENIAVLVRDRRSVRTFAPQKISAEHLEKLTAFMNTIETPYGIPVTYKLLDVKKHGLSSPVISGGDLYIGGAIARVPHAEEAFGYSFEQFVLYAQSLGIGTTWMGGTMDRTAFERAMELEEGEMMPCVSPLGYPAEKMSLRETMMRKGVKASSRAAFGEVFFDGSFAVPLTKEKAGKLAEPLEMVRLAPSAVNKQPWRVLVTEDAVHFYMKKPKGVAGGAMMNMQKIDMGIALCHFALSAKELGIAAEFNLNDPGLGETADMEYIASYLLK